MTNNMSNIQDIPTNSWEVDGMFDHLFLIRCWYPEEVRIQDRISQALEPIIDDMLTEMRGSKNQRFKTTDHIKTPNSQNGFMSTVPQGVSLFNDETSRYAQAPKRGLIKPVMQVAPVISASRKNTNQIVRIGHQDVLTGSNLWYIPCPRCSVQTGVNLHTEYARFTVLPQFYNYLYSSHI